MSPPLTPDVAMHTQFRERGASWALTAVLAGFILVPLHPLAQAILHVSPWVTGLGGGACLCVMAWTNQVYRRHGLRSRRYDIANACETTAFTLANAAVVCASRQPDHFAWLFYAGHLVHCGVAGYQRRYNRALFTVTPIVMTAWFALVTDLGATLLMTVLGLFSLYTYRTLSGTASQLHNTTLQRDALAAELTQVRLEEERQRIARDLHDGLGSDLAALHWQIEGLRASMPADAERDQFFESLRGRLTQGAEELRNIVWELRAGELLWSELGAYLERRCHELCGARFTCHFTQTGDATSPLPSELHVQVARFVQEGVRNAVRHSGGRSISVALLLRDELRLAIADDGRGVEDQALTRSMGGLRNMRQRVESLGGQFYVEAMAPGTRLTASIPLPAAAAPPQRASGAPNGVAVV